MSVPVPVRVCVLPSVYTSPPMGRSGPNLAHPHADSSRKGSGPNKT